MLKQLPEVQASPELGTPQPVGTQPQTPLEEFTTVGHPHGSQAEGGAFQVHISQSAADREDGKQCALT